MADVDGAVAGLASRQFGLFSRAQVLTAGGTGSLIDRRLRSTRWLKVAEGVYGLPGWPDSWRRRLMAACLEAGPTAVVSHQSAAALHKLLTFCEGPVVVMLAHGDHQRLGSQLRQSTDFRPAHRTAVDGIPATTVARTLVDLAACREVTLPRLAMVVEDAHVNRRCALPVVHLLYDELRRPGKRGMRKLGAVLASRGPGYVPPESVLERRLLKVLREGGLPTPWRQYPLPWRDNGEGRVDLAYPDERVLLEADGRRWHARMDQMEADRRRDNEALNHGWRPYRFMWTDITTHPERVAATVRSAVARVPSA
ncbi:MAG TPA: hypothetical protein VM264_04805 [Acidimicrobiales bacterium]|nr:hypothetical protein [Acidimicrobiales bacterium]